MTRSSLINVETQLVGAVLANDSLYARASFLDDDAFSDETNALIWRLIDRAKMAHQKVTPAKIAMDHPNGIEPIGGLEYLNRLAAHGEGIVTAFGEAVDRLHEELQWKRISALSSRLAAVCSSRDKTPDQVLSGLSDIVAKHLSGGHANLQTKRQVAQSAIDRARERRETVTTGIDSLDLLMQGGLQSQRLYGMGGLYGRGKTILLGSISENLNLQSVPHLFFSLETPPEDIEIRSCARHLNLNARSIFDAGDRDHQTFLETAETYLDRIPDYTVYEFSPGATIDEIHRKILAAKSRRGIKGFIIDYWQLIRGRERGQSEEAHLRDCADRLAAICRQEDLWGIITAQIDERGRLKISESLLQSASLFIRLVREEDESAAYFVTDKSNYTPYADTGSESVPGMIFDQEVGPYFRNTEEADIGDLNREGSIKI